jgi:hypothetical protein
MVRAEPPQLYCPRPRFPGEDECIPRSRFGLRFVPSLAAESCLLHSSQFLFSPARSEQSFVPSGVLCFGRLIVRADSGFCRVAG